MDWLYGNNLINGALTGINKRMFTSFSMYAKQPKTHEIRHGKRHGRTGASCKRPVVARAFDHGYGKDVRRCGYEGWCLAEVHGQWVGVEETIVGKPGRKGKTHKGNVKGKDFGPFPLIFGYGFLWSVEGGHRWNGTTWRYGGRGIGVLWCCSWCS